MLLVEKNLISIHKPPFNKVHNSDKVCKGGRKRKFPNLPPCEAVKIPYSKIMLGIMEVANDISPGVNPEEFLNSLKPMIKNHHEDILNGTYNLDEENKKNKDQIRENGKFASQYKVLGETDRIRVPRIIKNEIQKLILILEKEANKMDKDMAVQKLKSMIDYYFT